MEVGSRRGRGVCFPRADSGPLLTFRGRVWRLWHPAKEDQGAGVSHNDPVESYTAVGWPPFDADAPDERFALGCASGRVQVWSARSGEAVAPPAPAFAALARGADCAVVAVALSRRARGSVFASCLSQPDCLEVCIADGTTRSRVCAGKESALQLASCFGGKDDWLLSVCRGSVLKLWNFKAVKDNAATVPAATLSCRLAGSADGCAALDLCPMGSGMLALSADGTQQVDVFVVDGPRPEGQKKEPPLTSAFVLSSHEPVTTAGFARSGPGGGSQIQVFGAGPSVASVWLLPSGGAGQKGPRTIAPCLLVAPDDLGGRVLSVRPAAPRDAGPALVVAFGSSSNPSFAEAWPGAAKDGPPSVLQLSGPTLKVSAGADKAAGATPKEGGPCPRPTVLGPLEASSVRREPRSRAAAGVDLGAEEEEASGRSKRAKISPDESAPKAAMGLSLGPMVRQALRSKDWSSIDEFLDAWDRRTIDSTVADLTPTEGIQVLKECTRRLLSRPGYGIATCHWIQSVLVRHYAYIFSQPALHHVLQPLHDTFTARCSTHQAIIRMQGRLQALRAEALHFAENSTQTTSAADASAMAPLLEYTEGDEAIEADGEEDDDEDGSAEHDDGSGDQDGLIFDDSDDDDIIIDS